MIKRIFMTGAFLSILAHATVGRSEDAFVAEAEQQEATITYGEFLCELPRELGIYFTIEEINNDSPFFEANVVADSRIKTVDAVVKKMRGELKGIRVVQNIQNPSILHLIDERLLKLNDYVLNKKVDIKFSGRIDRLVGALQEQLTDIEVYSGGGFSGGFLGGDCQTRVNVDAQGRSVRSIITNSIPLKFYSICLWDAQTSKTQMGHCQTTIRHLGWRHDLTKAEEESEFIQDTVKKYHEESDNFSPLGWYLRSLQRNLGIYYTVERMGYTPEKTSPFFDAKIAREFKPKTIDELLEILRSELKGITVIQNGNNSSIIHLIDDRLVKLGGYPLSEDIDFKFAGNLDELAGALESQGLRIANNQRGPFGGIELAHNIKLPIDIDIKKQLVRDVLTMSVPLKHYSQKLWETRAYKIDDQKYRIEVRHGGLKELPTEEG